MGIRFALLAAALLAAGPVSATPHQLFLDFDTDGDLWTINPYSSGVPVSLVIQIGDEPIPAGSDVMLYFELGCYFDPESMEGRNCSGFDCNPDWGAPGVFEFTFVDCPPVADCWDPLLSGLLDHAFVPQLGERYLLGTAAIGLGAGGACAGQSSSAWGSFAGVEVESNPIFPQAPSAAPEEDAAPPLVAPSWGELKSLFR